MIDFAIVEHPLASAYLTTLRDKNTKDRLFKSTLDKLSYLLASFAYSNLRTKKINIKTPLEATKGEAISDEVVIIPILRAGLGLLNGFLNIYPDAMVSHVGIYRNEATLEPVKYYFKFPKLKNKKSAKIYMIDPMIATGGSSIAALNLLKDRGIKDVTLVSILTAPEGLDSLKKHFPDKSFNVKIYSIAIDRKLNTFGYILPGLGDAGDRYFGT